MDTLCLPETLSLWVRRFYYKKAALSLDRAAQGI